MTRAEGGGQKPGGGVKPPNSRSTRPAKASVVRSLRKPPMICIPIGRPVSVRPIGIVVAGRPFSVAIAAPMRVTRRFASPRGWSRPNFVAARAWPRRKIAQTTQEFGECPGAASPAGGNLHQNRSGTLAGGRSGSSRPKLSVHDPWRVLRGTLFGKVAGSSVANCRKRRGTSSAAPGDTGRPERGSLVMVLTLLILLTLGRAWPGSASIPAGLTLALLAPLERDTR